MPVTKLPPNSLLEEIKRYLEQMAQPGLNDSVPVAQGKGFVSGALQSMIPSEKDQVLPMPMATVEEPMMVAGKRIHSLLRNHPIDQLQRMIDQGYDVENVWFHGTNFRANSGLATDNGDPPGLWDWPAKLSNPHDPKGFSHIKPSGSGVNGPGIYLTNQPAEADEYAKWGGHIYPVVTKGTTKVVNRMDENQPVFDGGIRGIPLGRSSDPGTDSLQYHGGPDYLVTPRWEGDSLHKIVRAPKDVRSIFAKFDPTKSDHADLLASFLAALGVGMGAHERKD
jgi:hypothetical protein